MIDKTKIDLTVEKTESQWQDALDNFWLSATPRLFEWLRWLVILAATTYLAQRSNSIALKTLVGVCYLSLYMYYQAFFYQFEISGLPLFKVRIHRAISLGISALLGIGTFFLIKAAIDAAVAAHS